MKRLIMVLLCLPIVLLAKVTVVDSVEVQSDAEKNKQSLSLEAGALPAATYVITKEDIKNTNINGHMDLFRKLPGMITQDYGQGAIADGFGMRGFASGHGAEIGVWVDGVPINSPHHPHAHGFNDFDWITPEMIDHIEVIKGCFSPFYGNFAEAGVINIVTKKSVPNSSVSVQGGAYKTGDASVVIGGNNLQPITPFVVAEARHSDGYRDNQAYDRFNFFDKFSFDILGGESSIRVHYTDRKWNAPGYMYRPQLDSGLLDPVHDVFNKDGGDSKYYDIVANYSPKQGEKGTHITLYGVHEELHRFQTHGQLNLKSTPNLGANNQIEEHNDRDFAGGSALYNLIDGDKWSLATGIDGRYDNGTPERLNTFNRNVDTINPYVKKYLIKEINTGIFAQAQYRPVNWIKAVLGGRLDYFHTDVTNYKVPEYSGKGDFVVPSPKVGVVVSPLSWLDIFSNYGRGFRTPSDEEMSPSSPTGTAYNFKVNPVLFNSSDLGLSSRILDKALFSVDGYYMLSDGEIQVDPNTQEAANVGKTKREGVETDLRVFLSTKVNLYGGYEFVHAEILNPSAPVAPVTVSAKYLGIPEQYLNMGIDYMGMLAKRPFDIDLHWQMQGEAKFNPTSASHDPTTYYVRPSCNRFNLKTNYQISHVDLSAGVTWIPNGDKYNEQSSEFSIDPKPIWDFNVGIKYNF
jgi:outer membrane receptor protein involved in Fe transport